MNAKAAVMANSSAGLDELSRRNPRRVPDHGYAIALSSRLPPQEAEAVRLVAKRPPLPEASQERALWNPRGTLI
jgi:hypothetical protein